MNRQFRTRCQVQPPFFPGAIVSQPPAFRVCGTFLLCCPGCSRSRPGLSCAGPQVFCLLSLRHLGGFLLLRRLCRVEAALCLPAWETCAARTAAKMGIRRKNRSARHDAAGHSLYVRPADVPLFSCQCAFCWGFRRIRPKRSSLTKLAHIARQDVFLQSYSGLHGNHLVLPSAGLVVFPCKYARPANNAATTLLLPLLAPAPSTRAPCIPWKRHAPLSRNWL